MTVTANPPRRCVFAMEIVNFGRTGWTDDHRLAAHAALYGFLSSTLAAAGVDVADCRVEDRGDGALVLPPESVDLECITRAVTDELPRLIDAHNEAGSPRLQVRAGVNTCGQIDPGTHGAAGAEVNRLFRMLDAPQLRRRMSESVDALGVIVSGPIRDALPDALMDGFTEVEVQAREERFTAWARTMTTGAMSGSGFQAYASSGVSPSTLHGRSSEMEYLEQRLLGDPKSAMYGIVVHGKPGVGKTMLARAWAAAHASRYPAGHAVIDGTMPLVDVLQTILQAAGIPQERIPAVERDWISLYSQEMKGREILIVIDDAGLDLMARFPRLDGPTLLITTRHQPGQAEFAGFHALEIGPFGRDESLAYMRDAIGGDRADREPSAMDELAEQLDDQPLALSIASSNLRSWPGDTIADLIARLGEVDASDQPDAEAAVLRAATDAYQSFNDELKRASRLISLAHGLSLTIQQTARLLNVDESDGDRLVGDLQQRHFVATVDGERFHMHDLIRKFADERCQAEETEKEREDADGRLVAAIQREHMPEGVILPDSWTLNDALSYAPFADAIEAFLRSPSTRPPLTIGIKGAWGSGKTTLMRILRQRLDPNAGSPAAPPTGHGARRVKNRELVRGLAAEAESPRSAESYVTVWFNPWMYQRAEQIWAGLAHEIITQVTGRMAVADRERFWLALNLARVDGEAVRRRCHRMLFGRLLPQAVVWAAALVVTAVVVAAAHAAARFAGWATAGVTGLAALWSCERAVRFWWGHVTGSLTRLLHAPGPPPDVRQAATDAATAADDPIWSDPAYRTRTGYLHAVHEDVRHVLKLVATPERPLVVFVDDLDRCDSGTVAEVIEALNLFLAGEFPNCVFVIAMEPSAVAAHIEAAHPELVAAQHTGRLPGDWSSLGWRFLDKIVQLPLTLPSPREEHVPPYVESLLRRGPEDGMAGAHGTVPGAASRRNLSVDRVTDVMRSYKPTRENVVEAARAAQSELRTGLGRPRPVPPRGQRTAPAPASAGTHAGREPLEPAAQEAAMRYYAELYDDALAQQAITRALPVLGSRNPREIKRFVNLFRFYSYIGLANTLTGQDAIAPDNLAKLTALVVRWPQLLARLGHVNGALHPVNELETAASGTDTEWNGKVAAYLDPLLNDGAGSGGQPTWLTDLRDFLAREPSIGNAATLL